MNNSKLFVCYSTPLMKFLLSKNIRYEVVGLNPATKNMFWVFIRNKRLNENLKLWTLNNPNR